MKNAMRILLLLLALSLCLFVAGCKDKSVEETVPTGTEPVTVPVTKPTFQVKAFCVTLFAVIVSEVDNAAYAIAIPKIDVIAINNANL